MSIGFLCNGKPLNDYSHSEVVNTSCFLNGRPVRNDWHPSKHFGTPHGCPDAEDTSYGDEYAWVEESLREADDDLEMEWFSCVLVRPTFREGSATILSANSHCMSYGWGYERNHFVHDTGPLLSNKKACDFGPHFFLANPVSNVRIINGCLLEGNE